MRAPVNPPPLPAEPRLKLADERRRSGRLRCDDLECCLGEVLDISATGMRVHRKGRQVVKVDEEFPLKLTYGGDTVVVHVKVVRTEKVGFRRYSYGLKFLNVDTQTAACLSRLSTIVAQRRFL